MHPAILYLPRLFTYIVIDPFWILCGLKWRIMDLEKLYMNSERIQSLVTVVAWHLKPILIENLGTKNWYGRIGNSHRIWYVHYLIWHGLISSPYPKCQFDLQRCPGVRDTKVFFWSTRAIGNPQIIIFFMIGFSVTWKKKSTAARFFYWFAYTNYAVKPIT